MRPPGPVLAAVLIWAVLAAFILVFAVGFGVFAVVSGQPDGAWGALVGLVALWPGLTAFGLWEGNRGALVVAILSSGLLMILLLVVPASSRAWFARPTQEAYDSDPEVG